MKLIKHWSTFVLLALASLLPGCERSPSVTVTREAVIDLEMVLVKGGRYLIKINSFDDSQEKDRPFEEVFIEDFYIGKCEVTQGQWKAIMGSNPSWFKECGDNCPVESVTKDHVEEFIGRLNQRTGKSYRLPTSSEWEYAATSGGKYVRYSGTNKEPELRQYAWYLSSPFEPGATTHPVGTKKPNDFGLHDMTGNVWEWVANPGEIRGGRLWNMVPWDLSVLRSTWLPSDERYAYLGFRLALPVR